MQLMLRHTGVADAQRMCHCAIFNYAGSQCTINLRPLHLQDALKAFNLQDIPPWELASGAAAAVLLTYGLYRNRRRVKRAAKDFVSGVAQTAQMALGTSVNPMAAVPGTAHIMR